MRRTRRPSTVVVKFGGAALERPDVVTRYLDRIARRYRLVVVVSARRGVTDALEDAIRRPRDPARPDRWLDGIARRHVPVDPAQTAVLRELRRRLARLREGVGSDPVVADEIRASGERLAARWFASRLAAQDRPAVAIDADRLGVRTTGPFGAASIDLERSRQAVRRGIASVWRRGAWPVVTGYFGADARGRAKVLGRGGSDYSATALGYLLGAERVDLVKGGTGVRTADPRWVRRTRPVRRLSYAEAEALAREGTRLLHPRAIGPAALAGLEVRVVGLGDPRRPTRIDAHVRPTGPRTVVARAGQRATEDGSAPEGPPAMEWSVSGVGAGMTARVARLPVGTLRGVRRVRISGAGVTFWVPPRRVGGLMRTLHAAWFGRPAPGAPAGRRSP